MQHGVSAPGTIAMCFVEAALESARARHLEAAALLRAAGIPPGLLKAPHARVSARAYGALWRLLARALDDEFFGLDSRRMKSGSFALLCRSLVGCRDLAEALDRSLHFYALILDDLGGRLVVAGPKARIVLADTRPAGAGRVFAHETFLMLLHGVACWLVGRRIPIERAEFAYPEPRHSVEYRVMYSTTLGFDAAHTAIEFDARHLGLRVVQDGRSVEEFLRGAPANILVKYKNGNSLGARVRRRLRQSLPRKFPEFDALADEMHMAAATLRRRLHQEGTSYRSIKDDLRRDLAIDSLSHSQRSVAAIARELGFADRSAFHRAFRKWTGAAPGEFRRKAFPP